MKIRVVTESQARRSWRRLVDLQQRGYVYIIKRRGRPAARLERIPIQYVVGHRGKLD